MADQITHSGNISASNCRSCLHGFEHEFIHATVRASHQTASPLAVVQRASNMALRACRQLWTQQATARFGASFGSDALSFASSRDGTLCCTDAGSYICNPAGPGLTPNANLFVQRAPLRHLHRKSPVWRRSWLARWGDARKAVGFGKTGRAMSDTSMLFLDLQGVSQLPLMGMRGSPLLGGARQPAALSQSFAAGGTMAMSTGGEGSMYALAAAAGLISWNQAL